MGEGIEIELAHSSREKIRIAEITKEQKDRLGRILGIFTILISLSIIARVPGTI